MPTLHETLKKTFVQLTQSAYDLAGGLREDVFNDFLTAHWSNDYPKPDTVYKGGDRLADLLLRYDYDITAAAKIDLAPFTKKAFAKIYRSWIDTVPELHRYVTKPPKEPTTPYETGKFGDPPPENVKLLVPSVTLTLTPDGGPSAQLSFLPLNWLATLRSLSSMALMH